MRKLSMMSNNCLECVFHQKKCILGRKRPWNSLHCDDYRPYCLVCAYPEMFCNTCPNLGHRHLKPMKEDMLPEYHGYESPIQYDCVWKPQTVRQ